MVRIGSGFKAGHYTGGKGAGIKSVSNRSKTTVSMLRAPKAAVKVKALKAGKASYPNPLRG